MILERFLGFFIYFKLQNFQLNLYHFIMFLLTMSIKVSLSSRIWVKNKILGARDKFKYNKNKTQVLISNNSKS